MAGYSSAEAARKSFTPKVALALLVIPVEISKKRPPFLVKLSQLGVPQSAKVMPPVLFEEVGVVLIVAGKETTQEPTDPLAYEGKLRLVAGSPCQ